MESLRPLPIFSTKDIERFYSKVPKNLPNDVCWMWLGSVNPSKQNRAIFHHGYNPQTIYTAARIMWFLTYGEDPYPFLICHKCDTPQCINPECMFKGTTQANTADRETKGRGTKGRPLPPHLIRRGENGGMGAKLTTPQVIQIRKDHPKYSIRELAIQYNVSKRLIFNIIHFLAWKHIPPSMDSD